MPRTLVDTSVWIEFLNDAESPWALKLAEMIDQDEVVSCGLVNCEILAGIKQETVFKKTVDYLSAFDAVDDSGDGVRRKAVEIFRTCRARGLTIRTLVDCFIAAAALEQGVTVFARDRDFEHIAEVFPLQLVRF